MGEPRFFGQLTQKATYAMRLPAGRVQRYAGWLLKKAEERLSSLGLLLAARNFDQRITSRFRRIDRRDNLPDHPLDQPPPVTAKNHDRQLPPFEVLLIGNAVVGAQQDIETGSLGNPQQLAVRKRIPAFSKRSPDGVFTQKPGDQNRCALVKKTRVNGRRGQL
jgi:hypothetical protein